MKYPSRFGIAVRKIRIDLGVKAKDWARVLGVSQSFISQTETGGKNIPMSYVDALVSYLLNIKYPNVALVESLYSMAEFENNSIDTTALSDNHKELLAVLARKKLSDADIDNIFAILDSL